jgi:glycosyltransferase involved in cell wall biosynthesis
VRVCFVSHSSGEGGAEKALLETIDVLRDEGVECTVFLPERGAMANELDTLRVPYCVAPYKWWVGAKTDTVKARIVRAGTNCLAAMSVLDKAIQWRPHLIVSNTNAVVVGALVAYVLRRPHLWHLHEFGEEDHGFTFDLGERISYRVMDSLSSICVTNSRAVTAKYDRHIPASKLRQIYYSMHRFRPVREESGSPPVPPRRFPFRCIIVGRLSEGKGHQDAIEAIAELRRHDIRTELLVVGSGPTEHENYLRGLVRRYELGECVLFIGQAKNVLPFVQSADIVLMCSRAEAFGRVTVEAMLAEKPVIGANSGGTPELIQEGTTGLLYQPGNSRELADKLRYLCERPPVAKQMGVNAGAWARASFTKNRYSKEILSALDAAIKKAGIRIE